MSEVNDESRCSEKRYRTEWICSQDTSRSDDNKTCLLLCGVVFDSRARPKIREGELEL